METTVISLKEVCSNIKASIDELSFSEPELALKMKQAFLRILAEDKKKETDKLYRELKQSYY
jgi:hypothetical protein